MNLFDEFTVLEDGVEIGTFDTYEQAVEHLKKHAVEGHKYQFVRKFFGKEKKLLTVDDTDWKEEYKGMWADVDGYGNPLLILGVDNDNEILMLDSQYCGMTWAEPKQIHPRYDLAPVNLTPHPAYLETLEDYENAPEYTVIAGHWAEECPTYVKDVCGEWVSVGGVYSPKTANLAGDRRKVLYWPEEGEK